MRAKRKFILFFTALFLVSSLFLAGCEPIDTEGQPDVQEDVN